MGEWSRQWNKNIDIMVKKKLPVMEQFKGLQKFGPDLDDAEQLQDEILELKKKATQMKQDMEAKVKSLESLLSALEKKADEFDGVRSKLEKTLSKKTDKDEEDVMDALNGLGGGLNRIDALLKSARTGACKAEIIVK